MRHLLRRSSAALVACVFAANFALSARAEDKSAKKDPPPPATQVAPGLAKLVDAPTPLKADDKIAFFGDSITMQGGYIKLIGQAIQESPAAKDLGVKLLPHGLNGGRAPTLLEGQSPWGKLGGTMQELIEKEKPTVVVIFVGINDVWHGAKGTTPEDYEAALKKMLALARSAGAAVVLCTPTVIGEKTDASNGMDKGLDQYAQIVRKQAAAEKATLCDLRKAFAQELAKINTENKPSGILTYDKVHMKPPGNALIADRLGPALAEALRGRK